MAIEPGQECTVQTVVDENNVAGAVGSGLVSVFATPSMIAQMELAAATCMQPHLAPGQASVGAHVNVSHSAATPIGCTVTTTATVAEVDRRRVEFRVVSRDERGEIGSGTHTRFIIDVDKFMKKSEG